MQPMALSKSSITDYIQWFEPSQLYNKTLAYTLAYSFIVYTCVIPDMAKNP